MAWTLDNDPWCKAGTRRRKFKDATWKPEVANSFGVDPTAFFVVKQLVEANAGCQNQQCVAASMCVFFHLVLGHNKNSVGEATNGATAPPHSTTTSRLVTVGKNKLGNGEIEACEMLDDKMCNSDDDVNTDADTNVKKWGW